MATTQEPRTIVPPIEVAEDAPKFTGVVVIEAGNAKNGNFICTVNGAELRGRWLRANLLPHEYVDQVSSLPEVIPGQRVEINGRTRRIRVFDPLELPEFADTLARLKVNQKAWFSSEIGPVPAAEQKDVSDSDLKTWLYWAARMVAGAPEWFAKAQKQGGPNAIVVSGTLPAASEVVKYAGRTRISQQNGGYGMRYLEDGLTEAG